MARARTFTAIISPVSRFNPTYLCSSAAISSTPHRASSPRAPTGNAHSAEGPLPDDFAPLPPANKTTLVMAPGHSEREQPAHLKLSRCGRGGVAPAPSPAARESGSNDLRSGRAGVATTTAPASLHARQATRNVRAIAVPHTCRYPSIINGGGGYSSSPARASVAHVPQCRRCCRRLWHCVTQTSVTRNALLLSCAGKQAA